MHDNSCNKTGSEGKDELHNADPSAHLDELVNVARRVTLCGLTLPVHSTAKKTPEYMRRGGLLRYVLGVGGYPITSYRHGARW